MGIRAGAIAGLAGFSTFIALHSVWIFPIWPIAPVGAMMAVGIGAAVGWAFEIVKPERIPTPMAGAALFAGAAVALLPAAVIAQLGLRAGAAPLAVVVMGLLGSAALAGALLGALVGRSRRSTGACAFAAVLLAIGPGHNIPMLASTAAVPKEVALLSTAFLVSAVVLTSAYRWQRGRAALDQSARSGVGAPASIR